MGGIRFSFPACVIAGKGRIERHDLLILRKYAFADGIRTYDDALTLLAIDEMCPERCDEWPVYVIEQLTAFIVDVAPPRGRLDPLKSAWLMRVLARDGVIENPLCLELLSHAMECAANCPDMLAAFALDQLRFALGKQPVGAYGAMRSGERAITTRDLAYLWRILRRKVGGGRLQIPPLQASILNAIDGLLDHRGDRCGWREIIADIDDRGCRRNEIRAPAWLRINKDVPSALAMDSEIDVSALARATPTRAADTNCTAGLS